jgi:hypothetical protein
LFQSSGQKAVYRLSMHTRADGINLFIFVTFEMAK